MSLNFLSRWLHPFCSGAVQLRPHAMRMGCRAALPLIVPAMAGRRMLAKLTLSGRKRRIGILERAGGRDGVRRMTLGPVFMRVAMAGSAQSNI
jgi:hypothetical protein